MAHMSAHAILGVEEGATPAAVRKAWLRKARTLHPDKQGDTEEFQRLQNAYEQLVGGGTTASNNDSKTNLMRWASTYVSASSSTCSPPELNNVNAQDDTGRTALMYAAAHNAEALRMILANEADIASRNCGGHSALHFAYDLPECLEELIRAKADVNCSTYYGLTTLMLSAAKGNLAAVKVLLQAHAEVDAASDGLRGLRPRVGLRAGKCERTLSSWKDATYVGSRIRSYRRCEPITGGEGRQRGQV
eukprot:GEMP01024005.1.p1 GENE.GEMP01024005.1~~GEMP01024005.1.p1  ORF type:complete len:247 (+),score=48.40 GEMP01024005.1:138-878(+)